MAWQAEVESIRVDEAAVARMLVEDRRRLTDAEIERSRLEELLAEEDRALQAARQAYSDSREGRVRLQGEVNALRTRAMAAGDEIGRLTSAWEAAKARSATAQAQFAAVESEVAGLDSGEVDLDAAYEAAAAALAAAEENVSALQTEEREVERQRSAAAARRDALGLGLNRKDGSGALIAAGNQLHGVLGTVADVVDVESGFETAVAAALGAAADAVAVRSLADAAAAIALLKRDDAGRAGLLVGGADVGTDFAAGERPALPTGARYAIDVVTAPELLRPALRRLLDRTALVSDVEAAQRLVAAQPEIRAVTAEGDVLGVGWSAGGSSAAPSLLEVRAAHSEAEQLLAELSHRADRLRFALSAASEEATRAQDELDAAVAELHESDARLAAVAERLGQLGASARAAAGETERYARGVEEASAARDRDLAGLAELEARLAAAQAVPDDVAPDETERQRVDALVVTARATEVEARLAVRTGEERADALASRVEQIEAAAAAERKPGSGPPCSPSAGPAKRSSHRRSGRSPNSRWWRWSARCRRPQPSGPRPRSSEPSPKVSCSPSAQPAASSPASSRR